MSLKNAMIASAVASLFASAGAYAGEGHAGKAGAKVSCAESNSCKGQGSCGGADNSCATKNSCKGHVFEAKDAKACEAKHGKVVASAKTPAPTKM